MASRQEIQSRRKSNSYEVGDTIGFGNGEFWMGGFVARTMDR